MRSVRLFLALALSVVFGQSAHAATFTVTNTNDTAGSCAVGDCTLRQAITSANSQAGTDTITFASGLNGTVTLASSLPRITSDLTISAPAANNITLDGQTQYQILYIGSGNVFLSGLTFANGNAINHGGAFENDGTVTVSDCTFTGNHSGHFGGAIVNFDNSVMTMTRCTFTGNTGDFYGGAIVNFASAMVTNSTFSGNHATTGGAIFADGSTTLRNCTISGNSAANSAGGIVIFTAPTMSDCIVAGNTATNSSPDIEGAIGSGDYNLVQSTQGATLSGTHNITGLGANLGPLQNNGGRTQTFALQTGSPAIDAGNAVGSDQRGLARPFDTAGVTNVGNGADIGAVEQGSTLSVQSGPAYVVTTAADTDDGNCTVSDCSLREAVDAVDAVNSTPGSITFDPTVFATPQTIAIGSDFPPLGSSATITGSAAGVTIDTSARQSGFQVISGIVNLFDLTITGNRGNFGVQNSSPGATLLVRGCTFTGNFNGIQAAAGTTTVQNSTFNGNTRGILSTTNLTVANSTITGNNTGLYLNAVNGAITVTASNSIVAGNNINVSNNNGSSLTDGGHNLINVTTASAGLSSAGLQNNGGPTKTIALVPGSAVNGGDPAFDTNSLPYDQRGIGFARESGTAIDIGAFEAQAPTALNLTYNTVSENKPSGTFVGNFLTTDADLRDAFTYTFAAGAGDDDNASFSLNATGTLRTAAVFNLATKGSYSILVTTTDSAGLSLTKQFTITVLENSPPTVTITSPTNNQKLLIGDFNASFINGTAADNVGVTAVKVRLSRKRNNVNQFWNGTNFIATSTYLDASVTGSTNATWQFTNVPLQNKLDAGLYQVEAYAADAAGNRSAIAARPFTLFVDSTKPTVSINTPTTNQIININAFGEGTLTGVAGDDTGVQSVKIKLQRKRGATTTYWNGSAFTTTVTLVDATVTSVGGTSVTWSYDTPIPASELDAGAYNVYATATDAAGNFKTTSKRDFYVTGTAAPAPVSAATARSAGAS